VTKEEPKQPDKVPPSQEVIQKMLQDRELRKIQKVIKRSKGAGKRGHR